MLGRGEVGGLHRAFVEAPDRGPGLEVGRLHEAEIVGVDAENVVHRHPLVLADALPGVRGLAGAPLPVDLLVVVVLEMVDLVRGHILDPARGLLRHIGHEIAPVGHRADVRVQHLDARVGVLEQELGLRDQRREILVSVAVEEFGAAAVAVLSRRPLADREVDHHLLLLGVPDGLGRPGAADLPEVLREQLVDAHHVVVPVDQVLGPHEHQAAVVAPAVVGVPLPLRVAVAEAAAVEVQVGHHDVERAVRAALDVRVADALLLSDVLAVDDGLAVVDGGEVVAVVADGHEQRMGGVVEVREEVRTHLLFGRAGGQGDDGGKGREDRPGGVCHGGLDLVIGFDKYTQNSLSYTCLRVKMLDRGQKNGCQNGRFGTEIETVTRSNNNNKRV